MRTAYLGLGSNLGDREKNLITALRIVGSRFEVTGYSSIYQSSPVGYDNQPSFLNMVVQIDSDDIPPDRILSFAKKTESRMGREKTFRWGPRIIDIDILYVEDIRVDTQQLTVPHRELFNRKFVLAPLSEITGFLKVGDEAYSLADCLSRGPVSRQEVAIYKSREDIDIHDARHRY
jgi:2-amino-4-hydroxy-6-hydroxymethyldihydropteridine diphosphokinase